MKLDRPGHFGYPNAATRRLWTAGGDSRKILGYPKPRHSLSSLDARRTKNAAWSLGADAYIVKRKFDHEDLLNTINQIL